MRAGSGARCAVWCPALLGTWSLCTPELTAAVMEGTEDMTVNKTKHKIGDF